MPDADKMEAALQSIEAWARDVSKETDKYGNPTDGSRLIYCCFPDCGCDGARLCMAEKGASPASFMLNLERGEGAGLRRRELLK